MSAKSWRLYANVCESVQPVGLRRRDGVDVLRAGGVVGTFTFGPAVDGVGDCTLLIRFNDSGSLGTSAGDCEYDLDPDGTGIGEITVPGFPSLSMRFVVVDSANEIRFSVEGPPGQIVSGVSKRQ